MNREEKARVADATARPMFSGCLLAFRRRFHTASQCEKSVKSRRLVARTKKKRETKILVPKKSARLPRGWWRVDPVARLRRGAVRQCLLRYKLQGIGRGGRARRSLCPSPAVCSSGGLSLGAGELAPIRSPLEKKRLSVSSYFSQNPVHPCSPIRGNQRRSASGARVVAPPDLRPPRCLGVPAVQSFSSSAVSSRIPS